MAVKSLINAQFTDLAFYIPTGFGKKNKYWVPRIVTQGTVLDRELKVNNFRDYLKGNVTRADLMGQSESTFRMIEDVNTRPANLRTVEMQLKVKVYNDQANARATLWLPPLKDTFDSNKGSADLAGLEAAIIANLAILVRMPGEMNDVAIPVQRVEITPIPVEQKAAPPATLGIDANDYILASNEQIPAAA